MMLLIRNMREAGASQSCYCIILLLPSLRNVYWLKAPKYFMFMLNSTTLYAVIRSALYLLIDA